MSPTDRPTSNHNVKAWTSNVSEYVLLCPVLLCYCPVLLFCVTFIALKKIFVFEDTGPRPSNVPCLSSNIS